MKWHTLCKKTAKGRPPRKKSKNQNQLDGLGLPTHPIHPALKIESKRLGVLRSPTRPRADKDAARGRVG